MGADAHETAHRRRDRACSPHASGSSSGNTPSFLPVRQEADGAKAADRSRVHPGAAQTVYQIPVDLDGLLVQLAAIRASPKPYDTRCRIKATNLLQMIKLGTANNLGKRDKILHTMLRSTRRHDVVYSVLL